MEDADLRQNFKDIKEGIALTNKTSGETKAELEKHIRQSIDRKGEMKLEIVKVKTIATGADLKIEKHLGWHLWLTRLVVGGLVLGAISIVIWLITGE